MDAKTFAAAALCLGLAACSEPAQDTDATEAPYDLTVIEPGGSTACSDGSPYRFAVLGGDPDKVVLDFAGGGACWNDWTCALADEVFSTQAPTEEQFVTMLDEGIVSGIYLTDRSDNPLADWTVVHVSYCTGDVHWGDQVVDYTDEVSIHHVGQHNVDAVFEWLQANHSDIDQLLVTGESAGSYGAIAYAPRAAELYPDATVTILGDSGTGIFSEDFLLESFPNWNAEAALPMHLPRLQDKQMDELTIEDLYLAVAEAYPDFHIGQYTTAYDIRQDFYYQAMGGTDSWTDRMRESLETIHAQTDSFSYYVAPGQSHCIHPYAHYYDRTSGPDEVPYTRWLDDLLSTELPEPVDCDADDSCLDDPVCDACVSGESDAPECVFCDGWE